MTELEEIKNAIETIRGKYLANPLEIKRDYRTEEGTKNDYKKRQIYELLQNADDCHSSVYKEIQVNFCLNYGGRDEIVKAAQAFAKDVEDGKCASCDLTEEILSGYMYSADVPDPELIIRPSGEQRLSNFLLWQSAYSEFVFMNVLWPDFTTDDLDAAIAEYYRRNRRFGGT